MITRFSYRLEFSYHGPIWRPVAKVTLYGFNGKSVVQNMYIDSGADHTLLPYKIGLYLGFKTTDQTTYEVQGANGALAVVYVPVEMQIGKNRFEAVIAWAQIDHVPLLLGRVDVFDRFEITFLQEKRVVHFKI